MKQSNQNTEIKFAYLSQGKLFFKDGDREVCQIESEFGNDIIKRSLEIHQRNEWKTKGKNTYFSGGILWNVNDSDPRSVRIHVSGVTRSSKKEKLFFILQSNNIGGLFLYDLSKNNETRLFHKENFRARDLNLHPALKLMACSQYFQNGTANIIIMNEDGRDLQTITEGDSFDEAPSWIPGKERQIVFQSAGIARNEQGYAIGIGPFTIQKLDLKNGSLITLKEDQAYDFLLPRINVSGELFFIRRPYKMLGQSQYSLIKFIEDFFMFPFRLLRAIFHFLNFFSLTFSRKPLTTAGGPKMKGLDQKDLILRGRIIEAQKAYREYEKDQDAPSLVASSWELVRRSGSGEEKVIARGVVAYDFVPDGGIIYTNGRCVYRLDEEGPSKPILKTNLIEDLAIINQ